MARRIALAKFSIISARSLTGGAMSRLHARSFPSLPFFKAASNGQRLRIWWVKGLLRRRSGGPGGPRGLHRLLRLFFSFLSFSFRFVLCVHASSSSSIFALRRRGRGVSCSLFATEPQRDSSTNLFVARGTILRLHLILRGHYVGRHRQVLGHILVLARIVPVTFRVFPLVHLIILALLLRGRVYQLPLY